MLEQFQIVSRGYNLACSEDCFHFELAYFQVGSVKLNSAVKFWTEHESTEHAHSA